MPGELVVGVPARDVVVVTGSQSAPGLEKARRCVERVFFAGGENLLSRTCWCVAAARGSPSTALAARRGLRPAFGAGTPARR